MASCVAATSRLQSGLLERGFPLARSRTGIRVRKKSVCAAIESSSSSSASSSPPSSSDAAADAAASAAAAITAVFGDLTPLKAELLAVVAGLDRGILASEEDVEAAEAAAIKLESAGSAIELPRDLDKLQGKWRLVYSSAFASGNLGGRRPGPPVARFPLTLGQVFQRIDVLSREFDNIVELQIATPWPLPPLEIRATLAHIFQLPGGSAVKIVFEKTSVKSLGVLSELPPLQLPSLPDFLRSSSADARSGEFDVTYLDDDFRVTRGDRGELRVFIKL